jgi:hypothetical protein
LLVVGYLALARCHLFPLFLISL